MEYLLQPCKEHIYFFNIAGNFLVFLDTFLKGLEENLVVHLSLKSQDQDVSQRLWKLLA